jgi:TusA-related sulfurtransferase
MANQLDCRGLACPAPVLKTKQTIETENLFEISVIVDNQAAKENVSRFLENRKFVEILTCDLIFLKKMIKINRYVKLGQL